jgi:predicted esterase
MKSNNNTKLGFIHRFIQPAGSEELNRTRNAQRTRRKKSSRTFLLLHGTGGNEEDLIPLAHELDQSAPILSPRGKVLENGTIPRYFRRLAEGVFDVEDLKFRTNELANFIKDASNVYDFDMNSLIAVGYSNGANIASSMLLLRPEILSGAILFRPMIPLVPPVLPDLTNKNIFMSSGLHDPIVSKQEAQNLVSLFKQSGAKVSSLWQNSGHELRLDEIKKAKEWLSNILLS